MAIGWKRSRSSVAMVVVGVLIAVVARAQPPTVQPDLPSFGLVGMTPASEFVRLNVSNMRVAGLAFLAPPGTLTVGPCTVSLTFSDDQGRTLKRSRAHLAPGRSTSLDLTASDLPPPPAPGRVEILPAVARDGGCIVTPSVEVIGTAANQTNAYVLRKGANGNGFLPAYGLVGMALASQFIRLNVSNQAIAGVPGFGDCDVALTFFDTRGGALKQSGEVHLALGTSTRLDLTAADLPPNADRGPRVEVLPSLANSGQCALNPSVEVVTTATGQTNAYAGDAVLSTNH
ncbi:MAG TPA: hypothetical protein VGY99_11710 [Candidatus Binataceae bacterium]|jgi:hypothetical protein|nr:hypothetical protein [Candidatus Binataceae bacterium]